QPAAGGDPRRGQDGAPRGGPRRRDRRAQHDDDHARLRPPDPLRGRRGRVPGSHQGAARAADRARALAMAGLDLRAFESPDEVREFEYGRFELVNIGGMAIGRATYEPGWRWSR